MVFKQILSFGIISIGARCIYLPLYRFQDTATCLYKNKGVTVPWPLQTKNPQFGLKFNTNLVGLNSKILFQNWPRRMQTRTISK